MSVPTAAAEMTVNRRASAPKRSTTSSGSMPFPRDLDIFRPRVSLTVAWRYTVLKGASPMNSYPAMIIRATQKKRISGAVESTCPG
jgi:hypothetical protein